jgi:hypothetical protein
MPPRNFSACRLTKARRTEFRDTLEKLQEGGQKRAFAELQTKAQQFGVAGLSAAEKTGLHSASSPARKNAAKLW